jgi:hypothetical protein
VVFIDLDLPEIIAKKKVFFDESERYHRLASCRFRIRAGRGLQESPFSRLGSVPVF